ncbi:MAG: spermidine/putrescine ABC transporter substrate-binding protein [Actinomycetota bacterium]|nr:spermidine/putrescine ABC transporter substrate-binding protein [Actinomycetota bacterium]
MTDLTRSELLRRAALGGTALTIPGFLAACGGDDAGSAGTTTEGPKELAATLKFSNWTLYIDRDEKTKKSPTLDQFKEKTGTTVQYFEDVNDNATYFGKIQRPLSQGQSIDRDIIVLTDNSRFPGLLIQKEWAEKLDKSAIPNIANLQDSLRSPSFDPDREYSLPWQSGITGIASNLKLTKTPVTSVDQLLEDSKLKGKVTLLTEMADTLSVVMLANGDDPAKVDDASFDRAFKRIQRAVDSGQVRQFTGNDYTGPLSRGDLAACISWSGDVVQLTVDNPNLVWNLADSGGDIWTDNMLIPKGGDAFTASTFMNFVYDPKIAAQLAAYINYVSPVKGAKEEAAKIDPKLADNPLIFPDEETLSKTVIFDSEALNNQDYLEKWQSLIGA